MGLLCAAPLCAQDASTGAIRGTVEDPSGARIVGAQVVATNEANGLDRRTLSGGKGTFAAQLLSPGDYTVRVAAVGMQAELQRAIRVEIGSSTQVAFQLSVAGKIESITLQSEAHGVESEGVSILIDSRAINDLPLASRRFTDLALLTPGVTQDPRGLTSGANGDLSSGGVRGFQTSFLVDGADNNNAFFSQARGRYRAPYQFSNVHLSLLIEAFNLFNHLNRRVLTDSESFVVNTTQFVPFSQRSGATYYPAQYRRSPLLNGATGAYAPRQVQIAARLTF
jgi:hypothetical protein